jgi:hypothetical protein
MGHSDHLLSLKRHMPTTKKTPKWRQITWKVHKNKKFLWGDWVPSPLVRRGEVWPNNLMGTPSGCYQWTPSGSTLWTFICEHRWRAKITLGVLFVNTLEEHIMRCYLWTPWRSTFEFWHIAMEYMVNTIGNM